MADIPKLRHQSRTPVGPMGWIGINGTGKLKLGTGTDQVAAVHEYSVSIVLEGDAAKQMIESCWQCVPAGTADLKVDSMPFRILKKDTEYSPVSQKEMLNNWRYKEGEKYVFTFKQKTTDKNGVPATIKVIDKNTQVVNLGDRKLGNGTRGSVYFTILEYKKPGTDEVGVAGYLDRLQVTSVKWYDAIKEEKLEEGDFDANQDAALQDSQTEPTTSINLG